jgi:pSer/pThr/pTyr-binding forkhead associated (FHA) protein
MDIDPQAGADADTVDLRRTGDRGHRAREVVHEVPRWHGVRVGALTVALDRPAIVGRRPTLPRVVPRPEPRLVAVNSPHGEVSASHVEIRQVGSTIVVADLRSTNGTRVAIPGRQPVSLRQGESITVLAGTIVDIGDGKRLEILPITRLIPQEEPHP